MYSRAVGAKLGHHFPFPFPFAFPAPKDLPSNPGRDFPFPLPAVAPAFPFAPFPFSFLRSFRDAILSALFFCFAAIDAPSCSLRSSLEPK